MCEKCHEEGDENYEGDSIEEMRRKATRAVIQRHPELGVNPEEVTYRFVPKAERQCIRLNLNPDDPRYEIHVPSYMAQAMSDRPKLSLIAVISMMESQFNFEEACNILDIGHSTQYGAFFVSEEPPINPARSDSISDVREFERSISQQFD